MILDEQKHNNLYRKYYQGRINDYDEEKAIFGDWNYLTTQPLYAYFYTKGNGAVKEYVLKNGINIFNANCKTDIDKLHKYAIDNNIHWLEYSTIERLKNEDWTYVLGGDDKRSPLLDILIELGYDGFFNYEYTDEMKQKLQRRGLPYPTLPKEPAIGVLKETPFILTNTYKTLDDLMILEKSQDYKSKEMEIIKRNIVELLQLKNSTGMDDDYIKNIYLGSDTLTLSKSDLEDLIDKTIKDFNTDNPFIKRINEELEKYGKTLSTYNGIRFFKKD